MTLDQHIENAHRLDRKFQNLQRVFDEFRRDMVDLFGGEIGQYRMAYLGFSIPNTKDKNTFNITYLGRLFIGQFSAHTKNNEVFGKLALFEKDAASSNLLKKCEYSFTTEGTVVDFGNYDDADSKDLRIGHSRPNNLYFVLSMVNAAVSDL